MSTLDADIKSLRTACKRFVFEVLKEISETLTEIAEGLEPIEGDTTKVCKCGNRHLVCLRTENRKLCLECKNELSWYLDPGQKPDY